MRTYSKATLSVVTALISLFCASQGSSDDYALVPLILFNPVPGLNGAQWKTDFTMENYGDVTWSSTAFAGGCSYDFAIVPAHETVKNPFCMRPGDGALLDIRGDQRIRFQLRVRDVAGPNLSYGTEIPVTRASSAIRGPSAILDIPASASFRRTFRLYNMSRTDSLRISLKIRKLRSEDVAFEINAELPPSVLWALASQLRLSDGAELPDLEELGDIKVEVVPERSDVPYWWFLSLASNTTNEITVVSPQSCGLDG